MPKNQISFKTSSLLSLSPSKDGKRIYLYDDRTEGLELTVTAAGTKTFNAYKWVNGRPRRVTLGRFDPDAMQSAEFDKNPLAVLGNNPGLTVEQARRLCRAVIGAWVSGTDPQEVLRNTRDQLTLGDLFETYMEHYAKHHTKTWKETNACFERYLSKWRRRPVKDITRSEVQLLVNRLGQDVGHTTANRVMELVRAIINKGRLWKLITIDNPATGISKFKLKPRKRFVQGDELPRLIEAIQQEHNEDIRDFVLISLSTGARKMNVLSMRWEHVDLPNAVWKIPDTKNDEPQEILLTQEELEILRRRFTERTSFEWVFPGTGRKGHLHDPKKGWERILRRAGITDLHLHDLRRTLGSYMAMTGASLSVIGNTLNHKDVTTTRKVYAHTAREAERQARMNAHGVIFSKKGGGTSKIVSLQTKQTEPAPDTRSVDSAVTEF